MKKEDLPLVIVFVILIALNVILDTFPIEGIISVGAVVCFLIYLGNIQTHLKELNDRVTYLEKHIEEKESDE